MKKILAVLTLSVTAAISTQAQGFIKFNNDASSKINTNKVENGASTGLTGSGPLFNYAVYYSTNSTSVNGQAAAIAGRTNLNYVFSDSSWTLATYGSNFFGGIFLSASADSSSRTPVPGIAGGTSANFVVIGWSASIGSSVGAVQAWFNSGAPATDGWIGQSLVSGAIVPGTSTATTLFGTNAPGLIHGFVLGRVTGGGGGNIAPSITVQPGNKTVTNGQSATFTVTYGGNPMPTFQWFCNGTNIPGQTGDTLTLNNLNANSSGNTYFATLTNVAGSVTSSNGVLTVVPPLGNTAPFITVQPANKTVTNSQSTTFSVVFGGTPTPTFQWFCNGTNIPGQTSSALNLNNVQTDNSGNIYFVTLTNSAGSVTSSNALLTVTAGPTNAAPYITVQPGNKTVTNGQSATFLISYGGTPTPYFQWFCNGTNIPGQIGPTLTLNNVATDSSGNIYFVTLTNSVGSVTSSNAVLTVTAGSSGSSNAAPYITVQPGNKTVTNGQSATFSVAYGGTPTPKFQWFCNGTNIPGKTSSTLTLTNVMTVSSGNIYFVALTNSVGSVTSSNGVLTVTAVSNAAPVITIQPANKTVVYGASVSFSVAYTGTPTPTFQWFCNGTNIPGRTGSGLTLNNVTFDSAGNYSVTLTNSVGSVTSSNGMLTVTVPPATVVFANTSATVTKISTNSAVDGAPTGLTGSGGILYRYALYASTNAASVSGVTNAILGADSGNYAFTDSNWTFVAYATNSTVGRLMSNGTNGAATPVTFATGMISAQFVVIGWSAGIGADVASVQTWFNGGHPTADGWIGQSAVSGAVPLGGALFSTNAPYLQGFTLGLVEGMVNGHVSYAVAVTPSLILQATVNGQSLQLTWPVAVGTYGVSSASSPAGPWGDAGLDVTDDGVTATTMVPITGDQQYFRLQAQ